MALAVDGLDGEVDVGGGGEVVWVDEGWGGHVAISNRDRAAGERGHEGGGDGGVVVAVAGISCLLVEVRAGVAVLDQPFEFGPVRGEGGVKSGLGCGCEVGAVRRGELFPAKVAGSVER